jgi:hypothetical protein
MRTWQQHQVLTVMRFCEPGLYQPIVPRRLRPVLCKAPCADIQVVWPAVRGQGRQSGTPAWHYRSEGYK